MTFVIDGSSRFLFVITSVEEEKTGGGGGGGKLEKNDKEDIEEIDSGWSIGGFGGGGNRKMLSSMLEVTWNHSK